MLYFWLHLSIYYFPFRLSGSVTSVGAEPIRVKLLMEGTWFSILWSYSFMRIEPTPALPGFPAGQHNCRFPCIYQLYNHISQFIKSLLKVHILLLLFCRESRHIQILVLHILSIRNSLLKFLSQSLSGLLLELSVTMVWGYLFLLLFLIVLNSGWDVADRKSGKHCQFGGSLNSSILPQPTC